MCRADIGTPYDQHRNAAGAVSSTHSEVLVVPTVARAVGTPSHSSAALSWTRRTPTCAGNDPDMLFLVCMLYPLTLALLYGAASAHHAPVEGLEWLRAAILLLFLPILGKCLAHLLIAPWYGLVERL